MSRKLPFLAAAALLLFAAVLARPVTGWAFLDGVFGKKKQPAAQAAPQYEIHDEDSFKAVAKSFHMIPFNDPKLEFDILLPKDWAVTQDAPTSDRAAAPPLKIPENVATFKSPIIETGQATVTIQAMRLEHEISAENWLKNYLLANGYTLDGNILISGDRKAAASAVSLSGEDRRTYVYMTMQITGNAAMTARFESPLSYKDYLGFLRKRTIDSFRLFFISDDPVEEQKEIVLSDALKVKYPVSWKLQYPDFKNPDTPSMQIINETPDQRLDGMIRFVAIRRSSDTSLKKETENLRKYFSEFLKLKLEKLKSSGKAPSYERFLFSRYETYQTSSDKEDGREQEMRLVVLGDKEWYVFVFLLTPPGNLDFYTWATNVQTLESIVKRLR